MNLRNPGSAAIIWAAALTFICQESTAQTPLNDPTNVPRVALVLGAQQYDHLPAVPNAINDADEIARALRVSGFSFVRVIPNPRENDVYTHVEELAKVVGGESDPAIVVFFFAGHGFQLGADNYIVPVDVDANDLADRSVPISSVIEPLTRKRAGLSIFFFDACRNILTSSAAGPSGPRAGFASTRSKKGAVLGFATQFDAIASSAARAGDTNSPYSGALKIFMPRPHLSLDGMLDEVHIRVRCVTNDSQAPQQVKDAPGSFYFQKGDRERADEAAAWDAALASDIVSCYERFRLKYPDSPHLREALARIDRPRPGDNQGRAPCPER